MCAIFRTEIFRLTPQQAPLICHFVFMAHFTFRQSGAHLTFSAREKERSAAAYKRKTTKAIRWGRNACNIHIIQFEMHTLMTWSQMPNESNQRNRKKDENITHTQRKKRFTERERERKKHTSEWWKHFAVTFSVNVSNTHIRRILENTESDSTKKTHWTHERTNSNRSRKQQKTKMLEENKRDLTTYRFKGEISRTWCTFSASSSHLSVLFHLALMAGIQMSYHLKCFK